MAERSNSEEFDERLEKREEIASHISTLMTWTNERVNDPNYKYHGVDALHTYLITAYSLVDHACLNRAGLKNTALAEADAAAYIIYRSALNRVAIATPGMQEQILHDVAIIDKLINDEYKDILAGGKELLQQLASDQPQRYK